MPRFSSFILCGTPRSGSTLLCTMLAQTRIAGRPASYFREEDVADYAASWGVVPQARQDDAAFNRAFLQAMLRAGSAGTGVFGLRLMWPSLGDASKRLRSAGSVGADAVSDLVWAFGQPLFVHLSREDKVAQAVSLFKAERSGLWHLGSDGSILEGVAPSPVTYDGERIAQLLSELEAEDAAWKEFFRSHGIEPLRLTYEALRANPREALAAVLSRLGLDPQAAEAVSAMTAEMADDTSRQWASRFRSEQLAAC